MAVSVKYDDFADVLYVKRIRNRINGSRQIDDDDESIFLDYDIDGSVCGFVCLSPGQEAFESIKRNAHKVPYDIYNAYAVWYWAACALVRRAINENK